MVPRAGLEPAQSHDHEILSLARIPISPPRPKPAYLSSDNKKYKSSKCKKKLVSRAGIEPATY